MREIDLLIVNIGQVTTPIGRSFRRGNAMRELLTFQHDCLAIHDGRFVDFGSYADLKRLFKPRTEIDAHGHAVIPGFVDCHTHVVWTGSRIDEFEMRLAGVTYLDILKTGGGILSTVDAVRGASREQLVIEAKERLSRMMALGTTTVEVKSGYGLNIIDELKMLQVIEQLDCEMAMDLVPTFLGAHAVPKEFEGQPDEYASHVVNEMIPQVADWYKKSTFSQKGRRLYVDVFFERNAFDSEQSRQVLEAARSKGWGTKIHTDEFTSFGGVELAIEMDATSVDHLDVTTREDIRRLAKTNVACVLMPAVNFHLGSSRYANGRSMIDEGCAVALATDFNPGSAPCPSMPLVMAMACRYNGLRSQEALVAATLNAARAIGMDEEVGSIEIGKQADALILKTNEWLEIIATFGDNLVDTVIKGGVVQ